MKETVEQYKERIAGYMAGQEPLKIQATTAAKIAKLLKGATRAKLTKQPAPGKWSVVEILAHVADTEIVAGYRMRSVLGNPGGPIVAFDQDKWAAAEHYAKHDPKLSLETYRMIREANLRMLKLLKPEQWKQFGIHSERGEESIERITLMMAGHDLNHLLQIEAILAPKTAAKKK